MCEARSIFLPFHIPLMIGPESCSGIGTLISLTSVLFPATHFSEKKKNCQTQARSTVSCVTVVEESYPNSVQDFTNNVL